MKMFEFTKDLLSHELSHIVRALVCRVRELIINVHFLRISEQRRRLVKAVHGKLPYDIYYSQLYHECLEYILFWVPEVLLLRFTVSVRRATKNTGVLIFC